MGRAFGHWSRYYRPDFLQVGPYAVSVSLLREVAFLLTAGRVLPTGSNPAELPFSRLLAPLPDPNFSISLPLRNNELIDLIFVSTIP